jgi:hypothetical protein
MFMICSSMNAVTTPPDAPTADPGEERTRALLERLAEAGMEMVEALVAQAKGTGPKVVDGDVALAFSRVSRAVRMAALLQRELAPDREDPEAAAHDAEARGRAAQRDRAVRIVRRVARDHCGREPFAVSVIAREAAERLADDDIYGLAASRPVGELVALICRDLGLQPDWDTLAEEAWAQAEIEGGAAESPFLDDDAGADDEPEVPAGAAPRPARLTETLQDAVLALARDPGIVTAARRGSG